MKHEWRKKEKEIYLPKNKPQTIKVPPYKYLTIEGQGNPNNQAFSEYIGVLYSLSYAIKMSYKKGSKPEGYIDYTVYPLEGIWDINEEAKKNFTGTINKDDLIYKLMIRQPDFVDTDFVQQIIAQTKDKKPHKLLSSVKFETIEEGTCIQMLHLGSYDNEPESFKLMEAYATEHDLERHSKIHKEIYLSDARKTAPEKLKTVLRFQVKPKKCKSNEVTSFEAI
ncbi:GyrI-like domain-containing protein [Saccharicrinis fermentans]|uniref:GyrI-like small molecule binding domain-containing protein n=1 Tax=Saccharicrinis fermentans DSM 9555 = JCM 21142 TaxID=869213 RepID=W7Y7E0_9BACT|nr:GyrI-like domain-containing protein [Saccharicrinis fermentans]GAF04172.1 hypothetical protein JCM21142_72869 [Saccharicrinis fermentans DSM 9555 = JCM 21142]